MEQKVLTVSIAAYNVENYIRRTLDSLILPPEYMDMLDVIVVDDGSRDKTAQIVEEYIDRFPGSIRIVKKENGGYGSTINVSAQISTGKYYKLLDGDDWFSTENLCELLDFLTEQSADLIVTPFTIVNEFTGKKKVEDHSNEMTPWMHEITIMGRLLKEPPVSIQEFCYYTDTEYIFECVSRMRSCVKFAKPVYCYRTGREGQSVSLESTRKHYRDWMTVTAKLYGILEKLLPELNDEKKERLLYIVIGATWSICAFLTLEKSKTVQKEFIAWDHSMKEEYPNVYQMTMKSARIRWLRKSEYRLFGLYSQIKKRRIKEKIRNR